MKQTQETCQIAAFTGGALDRLEGVGSGNEVVLGLPLSRLIVKMIAVPKETDAVEFAKPILQKMCPFPDDDLTVSCETVRETDDGCVVIAAAMPESSADDIGEALDAAKLNVTRIDALVLGSLRGLWPEISQGDGRRLVLIRDADCLSIIVMDGDGPSAIRAVTELDDLRREVMLSLLEAEDFGGARGLLEIVVVEPEGMEKDAGEGAGEGDGEVVEKKDPFEQLSVFAPMRRIQVGAQAALMGIAERCAEPDGLNALPESWREVLEETRFKAKLVKYLAVAGGLWLLVMGVLFGVPVAYGFMTDYQKGLSKQHVRQYREVKNMKAKVDLIRKYSDHARGALEIMKAISDRLPEEITLSSWNYKRDGGVVIVGDSDTAEAVYKLKDKMDEMSDGEDGEGERIFGVVNLKGPSISKGKQHFELDCQYKGEEEE